MSNQRIYLLRLSTSYISTLLFLLGLLQPVKSEQLDAGLNSREQSRIRLLGPDHNRDGIRDDLEPILNARFGKDERGMRTASNLVISFEYGLLSTTPEQSREAHSMYLKAISCFTGLSLVYPELDAYGLMELSNAMGNTIERQNAMSAHVQRVEAMKLRTETPPRWIDACLDKYSIEGLKH